MDQDANGGRPRESSLNLDFLGMESFDLQELREIFSEEEVCNTIKELPPNLTTSAVGFIRAFYQRASPTIKHDVMEVMLKLFVGDRRGFAKL